MPIKVIRKDAHQKSHLLLTHIASFVQLPSTVIVFTLKSTPMVALCSGSKVSSVNLRSKLKEKQKAKN